MGCPFYLAMTAAEFYRADSLPTHTAWMACHFSPYGKGLSNFPKSLPPGSMLILNDRIPVNGHDPEQVARELAESVKALPVSKVLLDLQRPGNRETEKIVKKILTTLPCPVGVSHHYAPENGPVFVPPIPEDMPPERYLEKWENREIWLEVATDPLCLKLTRDGCRETDAKVDFYGPEHWEDSLKCHYKIESAQDYIRFLLYRTGEDTAALIDDLHIGCAVGLYQQFK